MANRKRPEDVIPKQVYLPSHLVMRVDLMHMDALTGKPRHGSFSSYIERLVREDLAKRGML